MAEYVLHGFAQSGSTYKAALKLALAHADWQPRFVDYFHGETRTPRKFVAADRLTIADLSICGYLFFDDEINVDWNDYRNLRDWLGRIRNEAGWAHPYLLLPGHAIAER